MKFFKNKNAWHKPDYILLATVFALVVFGLVILASASVVVSRNNSEQNYYYFFHQLIRGVLTGFILLAIAQKVDYRFWKKCALPFFAVGLGLLFLALIPGIGEGYGKASRWIMVGGFSFQPAEIFKLAFILYLAAWLEKRGKEIDNFSVGLIPFLAILALIGILLIKQPDIGTLGVVMATATIVYFAAGAKISHLLIIIFGGATAFWGLIKIAPYRMNRLTVFLHPETDPQGIGYQINQALLALGSGGLFGLGLGHSRQKYNYLPEPIGDSIFAIIGEEIGFVGLLVLLALFVIFAWRGFKIAQSAPDTFGKLAAVGITSWLVFQALMNIMAITSLIPLTGIPLPFISYGGTALITSLFGVGILLNISRYGKFVN